MSTEIERLQREIEERQAAIVALRNQEAVRRAGDLEAFAAMSPQERAELYADAPEHWHAMMEILQQQAEQKYLERTRGSQP